MAETGRDALRDAPDAVTDEAAGRSGGKAGSAPVYSQLADLLREKIGLHEWAPGSRIPSEHELRARFGISRGTVRRAISELV